MSGLGMVFKASVVFKVMFWIVWHIQLIPKTCPRFYLSSLQNIHTALTESYGLPAWGSYVIFGVATVLTGLILGMVGISLMVDELEKKGQNSRKYFALYRFWCTCQISYLACFHHLHLHLLATQVNLGMRMTKLEQTMPNRRWMKRQPRKMILVLKT